MHKEILLPKEELEKLYYSDKLTTREIAKLKGCNSTTVSKKLRKYNFKALHTVNRKKDLLKLTQEQKEIVFGMMLGDSFIRIGKYNTALCTSHSAEQLEYLQWKSNKLKPFSNNTYNYIDKKYNSMIYRFATIFHPEFNYFRALFYKKFHSTGNKYITPAIINKISVRSLAIWIMDDGSSLINHKGEKIGIRLYVGKYHGKNIVKQIKKYLKDKWDLNVTLFFSGCTYEIRFCKYETRKLMNLIKDYICPAMFYKFPSSETLCKIHHNEGVKTKSELYGDIQKSTEMLVRLKEEI